MGGSYLLIVRYNSYTVIYTKIEAFLATFFALSYEIKKLFKEKLFQFIVLKIVMFGQYHPVVVGAVYAVTLGVISQVFTILCDVLIPYFHKLPNETKTIWYFRATSSVHAAVMFVLSLYYWTRLNSDVAIHSDVSEYEGFLLDIMLGYIVYDTIVEIISTWDKEVMLHHVLGTITMLTTRMLGCGVASHYVMMIFLAEASTPFLHVAWLLNSMKMNHTVVFQFTVVMLILNFFIFRVLLGPFALYHMWTDQTNLWDGIEWFYWINLFVVAGFTLLNFFWFHKLISIALKKPKEV